MGERNGSGESRLNGDEGGLHGGLSDQGLGVAFERLCERPESAGGGGQETAVKIHHAENAPQLCWSGGCRDLLDGVNMCSQGGNSTRRHDVAQEGNLRLQEGAFVQVEDQAIGLKNAEDVAQHGQVVGHSGGGDQVVVKVDKNLGEIGEKPVHEPLECLGGILQAKGHEFVLKESKRGDDGSLWMSPAATGT